MQGVVHVAPDGETAKARWRTLVMGGTYGQDGTWTEGPYENEYVKENGVWKLSKVHWYMTRERLVRRGLAQEARCPRAGPLADLPPDRPPSEKYEAFPAFYLPPYHYLHPVTGKPVAWDEAQNMKTTTRSLSVARCVHSATGARAQAPQRLPISPAALAKAFAQAQIDRRARRAR